MDSKNKPEKIELLEEKKENKGLIENESSENLDDIRDRLLKLVEDSEQLADSKKIENEEKYIELEERGR